ncbi:hypothetical protein [Paenibacillus eucommiae]|uniref:Uncharacterized protein n=1 Tax=Paenibacillus eucommiae TaxID=1355755 RepID=A0ABS4J4T4_9BACL|nr:hypothetical protein [Paenibacillus eucommiae]MBP1994851.1 hypothetical protein [Paenibacillus eucommiae]
MQVALKIAMSTTTLFSMLFFSTMLFRFSIRKSTVVLLLLAAFITANFNYMVINIWGMQVIEPVLSLLIQSMMLFLILRIKAHHALIITFFGVIVYTLILGVMILIVNIINGVSHSEILLANQYIFIIKIPTVLVMWLLSSYLYRSRFGFTLVSGKSFSRTNLLVGHKFVLTFLLALLVFIVAIYAMMVHSGYMVWIMLSFFVALVVMLFYLYKKEMDGD